VINTISIIRLHQINEMQAIAIDDRGHLSVCHTALLYKNN